MRKRQPRINLEIKIRMQLRDTEKYYLAEIFDISEEGFKFFLADRELFEALHEGDLIEFETDVDFYGIKGVCSVVWIDKEKELAGVGFVDIDSEDKKMLKAFIQVCLE